MKLTKKQIILAVSGVLVLSSCTAAALGDTDSVDTPEATVAGVKITSADTTAQPVATQPPTTEVPTTTAQPVDTMQPPSTSSQHPRDRVREQMWAINPDAAAVLALASDADVDEMGASVCSGLESNPGVDHYQVAIDLYPTFSAEQQALYGSAEGFALFTATFIGSYCPQTTNS